MSASSIPTIKNTIINHSEADAKQVYRAVMTMDSSDEITAYLKAQFV